MKNILLETKAISLLVPLCLFPAQRIRILRRRTHSSSSRRRLRTSSGRSPQDGEEACSSS